MVSIGLQTKSGGPGDFPISDCFSEVYAFLGIKPTLMPFMIFVPRSTARSISFMDSPHHIHGSLLLYKKGLTHALFDVPLFPNGGAPNICLFARLPVSVKLSIGNMSMPPRKDPIILGESASSALEEYQSIFVQLVFFSNFSLVNATSSKFLLVSSKFLLHVYISGI